MEAVLNKKAWNFISDNWRSWQASLEKSSDDDNMRFQVSMKNGVLGTTQSYDLWGATRTQWYSAEQDTFALTGNEEDLKEKRPNPENYSLLLIIISFNDLSPSSALPKYCCFFTKWYKQLKKLAYILSFFSSFSYFFLEQC